MTLHVHDDDAVLNAAAEPHFSEVASARLSRRQVLGGGLAGAAAFLAGGGLFGGAAGASPGAPSGAIAEHGRLRGQLPSAVWRSRTWSCVCWSRARSASATSGRPISIACSTLSR